MVQGPKDFQSMFHGPYIVSLHLWHYPFFLQQIFFEVKPARKTAETPGGHHPVSRENEREGVSAQCLSDGPCAFCIANH